MRGRWREQEGSLNKQRRSLSRTALGNRVKGGHRDLTTPAAPTSSTCMSEGSEMRFHSRRIQQGFSLGQGNRSDVVVPASLPAALSPTAVLPAASLPAASPPFPVSSSPAAWSASLAAAGASCADSACSSAVAPASVSLLCDRCTCAWGVRREGGDRWRGRGTLPRSFTHAAGQRRDPTTSPPSASPLRSLCPSPLPTSSTPGCALRMRATSRAPSSPSRLSKLRGLRRGEPGERIEI